ncbi:Linear gramicidin synthase subunit D [compost metagenome]|uniref:Linear gramicidin synthase subunit C n=1 Tax=Pseudomonas wadenswilerensis TaxID=1785161 RepID=A0A380SYH2_9PSED|nr:non-ribosomal peptide synthetase [Pseudomonas wadenswilerensis]SUQ62644.1 Linear gramicidin synthase subunit C [Pseudomonas wadenswilerensis]
MSQLNERMLTLAKRFAALGPLEQKALQARMIEQGLSLEMLPIPPRQQADELIQASYAQQRLWFLWQLDAQSSAYNQPAVLRLQGALDCAALGASLQALINRHEALRTNFELIDDRVVQRCHADRSLSLQVLDRSGLDESALQTELAALIAQPFDLATDLLLRATLIRLGQDEHVLVFCTHHIVTDAWSMPILVDEVSGHYARISQGQAGAQPAALSVHYADYAKWQRLWLQAGEADRQLAYWQARLGSEPVSLALPLDRPRPMLREQRGARHTLALEPGLGQDLRRFASGQGATLFMVLLAGIQALLHRYSAAGTVRVGTPVANRGRAEVQHLIGFFVNTQVLQAEIEPWMSFEQLLAQVRERVQEAQANQDLPFEQLVDALQPDRSLNQTPLFQVLFNHQASAAPATERNLPGLRLQALDSGSESARFDLTFNTHELGSQLQASLVYAEDVFDAATIEQMAGHWLNLLRAALAEPQRPLGELALLAPQQQQALLASAAPAQALTLQGSVHGQIEQQARLHPERLALVEGERQLSYAALNTRANQLAHRMIALGVGAQDKVAILAERSLESLVALLATLKSGAAYVPLDPQLAPRRLQQMVEASRCSLVLGRAGALQALAPCAQLATLALDDAQAYAPAQHDPQCRSELEALAYVIHTSGSTGQPKGVMVSHGALLHYLQGLEARLPLADVQRLALVSTLAADLGHTVVFGALCQGRTLHLIDSDLALDGHGFGQYLQQQRIDALKVVPSHFAALLGQDNQAVIPQRCLILGGESPTPGLLERIKRLAPDCRVFNHYGPTECTVGALAGELEGDTAIHLGRALQNRQALVLDAGLQLMASTCPGELYLGGAGIARGYHEQPGLTAERFVPDPFAAQPGARMYRSGDLVRRGGDGQLVFIGRADQQLKIRGYRIETGEIEACLRRHPALAEALVMAWQEGEQQHLLAYLVPVDPAAAPAELSAQVADALRERLPAYMLPSRWVVLERLPLTANGKLDRKALPAPVTPVSVASSQGVGTALELRLASVWQEVLRCPQVGLDDNFFELGGDSIVSIQLVSRARSAGIHFSARDIFQHQTVRSLAAQATQGAARQVVERGAEQGVCQLLPIQQGFFATDIPQRQHWNQSILLRPQVALQGPVLEQALQALLDQHDALRARFEPGAAGWHCHLQAPAPVAELLWQRHQVSAADLDSLVNQAQRSLRLDGGSLLRALLVNLEDGSQRLLLAAHHLVVDGVSWRILLEDLQSAYGQCLAGQPLQLPPRTSSLREWAQRLAQWAHAPAQQARLDYWQAQLADVPASLPGMRFAQAASSASKQVCVTRLDAETTSRLLQQANGAYRTQINDLLLTALSRVLCRWTGQAAINVQLEGHGREELFDDVDLSRTVGWFTSLFPLRLAPASTLADSIKQIKEQLRAVPQRGIGFGALKYLGPQAARERLQGLPTPRITFNYLGQVDGAFNAQALLLPATESKGDERSPEAPLGNWLTVSGQVYQGRLSLDWTFSDAMFEPAQIQRLADDYGAELNALVGHCLAPGQGGLTPSDAPLAGLDQAALDALPVASHLLADLYPLSPMQQGMLFHSLYQTETGAYINQLDCTVRGLDPERLHHAWQATVDAHDILRTGFIWQGEQAQPLQAVYRHAELEFQLLDWRSRPDLQAALQELAASERARAFELAQAPLMRVALVRCAQSSYQLIYTHHHILMDGWSSSRLMGEVMQRYQGQDPGRPARSIREYIGWLQEQDPAAAQAFWETQLAGLQAPTRLLDAIVSKPEQASGIGHFDSCLSADDSERLKGFARRQRLTLNTLVQAAWALLLQRYTGQDSVCFGATVSGRPAQLPGIEQQVGLFINTLPVIVSPDPQQPVGAWLQQLQALNLALREYEHTPLYEIQRWAGRGGEALFDHILVFENFPIAEALQQAGDQALQFDGVQQHERTNYPLTLAAGLGDTLQFQFSYDRAALSASAVAGLAGHLHILLMGLAQDPGQALGRLSLLDAEHLQQRLLEDGALGPLVHEAFAANAARTPEAIALICEGQHLRYGELNARANQLAHRLRGEGAGPETLVGIAIERCSDLVVAVLAVLKSGAAYVPLDPEYPVERLSAMVADSGARLLLTRNALLQRLPALAGLQVLSLDDDLQGFASDDPQTPLLADNLAYVIFTSGSTGRPKGVAVSHAALARHTQAAIEMLQLSARDRVLQFATFNFDPFVEQLFASLTVGATVIMRGDQLWSSERWLQEVRSQGITVANLSTAYWATIARDLAHGGPQDMAALRLMICGGEAMSAAALADWRQALATPVKLLNAYGPTEATVTASAHDCSVYLDPQQTVPSVLPIGRPLAGRRLYLLDSQGQPAAAAVAAELSIGGELLARGYYGRPGLTAERFIPDPFAGPGARQYRTGDLVWAGADQVLGYLGRLDQQVKVRGYRIEPGEIEARLLEHPQVGEALVQVHQGATGAQLVAYLVPAGGQARLALDACKAWVAAALPAYMVPAHWVMLERLPLSPNGKLDRQSLPLPDLNQAVAAYQAPRDEFEQQVALIWQQVLHVEQVGLADNFFELGGHSLLATQVIVRLRGQMGLEVPLENLFLASDLAAFCSQARGLRNEAKPLEDELAKSLEALKRLSSAELEKLIS